MSLRRPTLPSRRTTVALMYINNIPCEGAAFPSKYRWDIVQFVPPVADLRFFSRPGERQTSDGLIVNVRPALGPAWYGMFSPGCGPVSSVCTTPDPKQILVVAKGDAYFVDSENPSDHRGLDAQPVCSVWNVIEKHVQSMCAQTFVMCCRGSHVLWATERLAYDDVVIDEISGGEIIGRGWNVPAHGWKSFKSDLVAGDHVGGGYP